MSLRNCRLQYIFKVLLSSSKLSLLLFDCQRSKRIILNRTRTSNSIKKRGKKHKGSKGRKYRRQIMVASQRFEDCFCFLLHILPVIRHLHQDPMPDLRAVANTIEHFLGQNTCKNQCAEAKNAKQKGQTILWLRSYINVSLPYS